MSVSFHGPAGRHFAEVVDKDSEGRGVALVTGDGGIDEGGDFNKHEWLLRRLVLCQARNKPQEAVISRNKSLRV